MSITFNDQLHKENQPVMNLFFYDIKTKECIYISLNQNTIKIYFKKIDTYNNCIFHLDNYNIKVNKYTNKRIYNIKKMSGDNVGICYKSNVSLKKTLDNIFFDDKIKLINILDKFKNNLLYPPNVSMDNKLGIFLYGPAGTGKTGLVSAIANYLDYDIININFAINYTIEEFEFIFDKTNYLNNIILFDEIDFLIKKLNSLDNSPEDSSMMSFAKLLVANKTTQDNKEGDTKNFELNDKSNNITIEYLLSKLDGIEDSNNRLIIATTNYPEVFEERFLRPGRFDIKINMGFCSKQMIIDIICNYYSISKNLFDELHFIENKFSPLYVQNECILNKDYTTTISKFIY